MDGFITLAEAARILVGNDATDEALETCIAWLAGQAKQLQAVKAWTTGKDVLTGGVAYERQPAEWRIPASSLDELRLKRLNVSRAPAPITPLRGFGSAMRQRTKATGLFFRMTVPKETRFFTVREIPAITAAAIYPRIPSETGRVVTDVLIQPLEDGTSARRPTIPTTDEWAILQALWAHLAPIAFPLPESEWGQYAQAVEDAKQPPAWRIVPMFRDEDLNRAIQRAATQQEHESQLSAAIERQEFQPLNPLTYLPEFAIGEAGRNALVTVEDFTRFAATLGIEATVEATQDQPVMSAIPTAPAIVGPTFAKLVSALNAYPSQYQGKTPKLDDDVRPWLRNTHTCTVREAEVFGAIIAEHFGLK